MEIYQREKKIRKITNNNMSIDKIKSKNCLPFHHQ